MSLSVSEAVRRRRSTRAFLDRPIDMAIIRSLLSDAGRAPSGGNLQPWKIHVVSGAARDRLIEAVKKAISENPFADEAEIAIYPKGLTEPYRSRRYALGEAMYELLGIPREDKMGRLAWLARNFEFFGAPVGLFFSLNKQFDKGQWAHLGMLMQTIALLAEERGLASCMQEAWATRAATVARFLKLPADTQLYCGMALGYADPDAAVNRLSSTRAPLEEFVAFVDE